MNLQDTLITIARLDINILRTKRKSLLKELEIKKEKFVLLENVDKIQTIFTSSLDLMAGNLKLSEQIKVNKDKYLKLFCKVDNKQHLIKSFGKIDNVEKATVIKIYQLIKLIKIIQASNTLMFDCASFLRADDIIFGDI